jgi:hypothetical protein
LNREDSRKESVVRTSSIAVFLSAALFAVSAAAQPVYYPAKHQSSSQQGKDRHHCDRWAVNQTGFDPALAQAPPEKKGGVAKGALIGGGVGGVAGSFNANAGKGLLAGAAVGGLIGGVRQHNQNKKAEEQQQANLNNYYNAYGACMKGRGYTTH